MPAPEWTSAVGSGVAEHTDGRALREMEEAWGAAVGWAVAHALRTGPAFASARRWRGDGAPPFRVACLGYRQLPTDASPGPDVLQFDVPVLLAAKFDQDDADLGMLTGSVRAQPYVAPLAEAAPEILLWSILVHARARSGRYRQSIWLLTCTGRVITSLHHTGPWLELADMLAPLGADDASPSAPNAPRPALVRHQGPFGEGRASILSAQEFQAALAAMQRSAESAEWRVVGDVALYRKMSGHGGYVDVQRQGTGSAPDIVLAELARAGGDALSDTYASITARFIAAGAPAEGIWVNVNDILRDRGIVPLPAGGHRTEDRFAVGRHLAELTNWRLSSRLPAWQGKAGSRRRPIIIESSLLTVTDTVYQTTSDGEQAPLAVRCALGDYARFFLTNGAGRQTCLLMQAALRYDPTHERSQKRLAYHFAFRFRLAAEAREDGSGITVGALFRDAHLDVDGTTQRANPTRTIQRWVDALNDLRRDGVIAAYELLPPSGEPPRGKLARWLAQGIHVVAPSEILARNAELEPPVRSAPAR